MDRERNASFFTAERKLHPVLALGLLVAFGAMIGLSGAVGPITSKGLSAQTAAPTETPTNTTTETKAVDTTDKTCLAARQTAAKNLGRLTTGTQKGTNQEIDERCIAAVYDKSLVTPEEQNTLANPENYKCVGKTAKFQIDQKGEIVETWQARNSVPERTCNITACTSDGKCVAVQGLVGVNGAKLGQYMNTTGNEFRTAEIDGLAAKFAIVPQTGKYDGTLADVPSNDLKVLDNVLGEEEATKFVEKDEPLFKPRDELQKYAGTPETPTQTPSQPGGSPTLPIGQISQLGPSGEPGALPQQLQQPGTPEAQAPLRLTPSQTTGFGIADPEGNPNPPVLQPQPPEMKNETPPSPGIEPEVKKLTGSGWTQMPEENTRLAMDTNPPQAPLALRPGENEVRASTLGSDPDVPSEVQPRTTQTPGQEPYSLNPDSPDGKQKVETVPVGGDFPLNTIEGGTRTLPAGFEEVPVTTPQPPAPSTEAPTVPPISYKSPTDVLDTKVTDLPLGEHKVGDTIKVYQSGSQYVVQNTETGAWRLYNGDPNTKVGDIVADFQSKTNQEPVNSILADPKGNLTGGLISPETPLQPTLPRANKNWAMPEEFTPMAAGTDPRRPIVYTKISELPDNTTIQVNDHVTIKQDPTRNVVVIEDKRINNGEPVYFKLEDWKNYPVGSVVVTYQDQHPQSFLPLQEQLPIVDDRWVKPEPLYPGTLGPENPEQKPQPAPESKIPERGMTAFTPQRPTLPELNNPWPGVPTEITSSGGVDETGFKIYGDQIALEQQQEQERYNQFNNLGENDKLTPERIREEIKKGETAPREVIKDICGGKPCYIDPVTKERIIAIPDPEKRTFTPQPAPQPAPGPGTTPEPQSPNTRGPGDNNPFGNVLSSLMRGLGSAPNKPQQSSAQQCPSDQNQYAQYQQQYNQQLQQYNYQQQVNQYYGYNNYLAPLAPTPPTPCSNKCPTLPPQPPASQCPTGQWRQMTTNGPGGSVCPVWQCIVGQTPIAELSCQPKTAEKGMTVVLAYRCANATASEGTGPGFTTGNQMSGTANVTINSAEGNVDFSLKCSSGGASTNAQCSVQVVKPAITLFKADPSMVFRGATSSITWSTTGMSACTVSSPDMRDFTERNKDRTTVNATVPTPPITKTTKVNLVCTTVGGNEMSTSTTIKLKSEELRSSVTSSIDGKQNVGYGTTVTINWKFPEAPARSAVSLWLLDYGNDVPSALIVGQQAKQGTYSWQMPSKNGSCDLGSSRVCSTDLKPGGNYAIEAALYTPPNAYLGDGSTPEDAPDPEYLEIIFAPDAFQMAK